MGDSRQTLGAWGESVAAEHLQAKGYRIIERNWRCARGEVDIIAWAGSQLIFVEVKTRRGRAHGAPEEALTQRKSERLVELATLFVAELGQDVDWRIDLVAVELDATGRLLRCEHIPNAVLGW